MESRSERYTPPAPRAAPCLRVLQWNVQGLRPKRHEVLQAIFQEGLDLVLLQETLTPADFTWRVAGYTLHSLSATGEGGRGCVTLVKSAIPHRRITAPMHCGDGVETLAVKLQLGALSLTVYNIYRSQRHQLEAGELLGLAAHSSVLVGGDFNSHHPLLQSVSPTNAAGRHLAVLLEDSPHVRLLNTWGVHPTLTSDHYGIVTTLTVIPLAPPSPPLRWNIRGADWVRFRATLEEWWADYQPPFEIHQQERDLTAAMERAADAAIPRSAATRRRRRSWWSYDEEVREHNHRVNVHRKLYKKRPTATNLGLLQEVVARARQVSLRAKEKKWLEWCASYNQHTPSEQLRPQRDRAVTEASKEPDVTDIPFTQQGLARGRDTAAGADGVTYSMLAHAGPAGDAALLALLNASWRAGRLPPAWKEADIQPIPKPREPTKLRPISLLSCTGKTAERMVLSRLQWRVGGLHNNVFGFPRGLSTADSITTLLAHTNNRPTIAVFLDLEKAFELASPYAILAALGGVLSPILFNLLMEDLVALPFRDGADLLSYADDLALVVTGRGNKLTRAQEALDLISDKCEELGLKISADKSRAMAIKVTTPACQLCPRSRTGMDRLLQVPRDVA
ncbi:uncharacterized protein LOC126999146 [Eriocheir sinensis]|uniref:uncharacterized protein LOC126999146 n=1 Tax=Eriocheir sinensis TaxID=95602 RepID=UPI0021CAB29D|nr:uncharacterized protein LOC126999146 [Eriocheir sinensis]